ncbi:MAG TPA: peptidoglycan recognition family protein [Bryobacteraceae bacterium]|nr:peptidoglycan recognition family protein [Bryobacteraceae bacterium]
MMIVFPPNMRTNRKPRLTRISVLTMLAAAAAFAAEPSRDAVGVCTLDRPLRTGARRAVPSINTIVLHHTAIDSAGDALGTLRLRGLSYHYLVTAEGRVIEAVPRHRIALHAAGANRHSIGISMVGGSSPDWQPGKAQLAATKRLIGQIARTYTGIRYVIGHGDVRDTNRGEPFGVDFPRLLRELSSEERVALQHPGFEQEPVAGFRIAALRLLAHPLTPRYRAAVPNLAAVETATCPGGETIAFPVNRDLPGVALLPASDGSAGRR